MRTIISLVASFLVLLGTISAQTPTPTSSPTPVPSPEEGDVVKISTSLIQIDVTVTDRKGNVLRDLKPEEVEVYENGKKQAVTHFSFVNNSTERVETGQQKNRPISTLPQGPVKPESVRRTVALVVDDLSLSFESTYYIRQALKKFVDEQMQSGDLVAIIRTGAGIGALQQFTSDKRMLYAAIEKIKWNSYGTSGISAFEPLRGRTTGGQRENESDAMTAEDFEREQNEFRSSVFATGTLGAVRYIVRGMEELPGRKSVMLLSHGFRLFTTDRSGFRDSTRVIDSLRRLVDQANRSAVVIYALDPRGLQFTGITAADDVSGFTPEQVQRAIGQRSDDLRETQDGLTYLARQTGGFAIINNNDVSGGIRRVLDDQSYYLVGYEPDEATFDPKVARFNKLVVKVTRPGARVRYRSGFFGISDEKLRTTISGSQKLIGALVSPFASSEISLRLNGLFVSDGSEKMQIRSFMHIRAGDLTFNDEPNGDKTAVFDLMAVGFGDNGVPVDQISKTYTLTLKKDRFEQLIKTGFVYDFVFPVKKAGAYQLRVAMRDQKSDKVGSANQFVEVPNLKRNRLTLSGAALDNLSYSSLKNGAGISGPSDPLTATSLRQFKRGSVLTYGFAIYNARLNGARKPNLSSKARLYKDGVLVFQGNVIPVPEAPADPKNVQYTGSLALGNGLSLGDYVLEIEITDNLVTKDKFKAVRQYVQFEIID